MEGVQRTLNATFANPYFRSIAYISVFVLASHTMGSNKQFDSLLTSHIGRFVVYFFAAYIGSKDLTDVWYISASRYDNCAHIFWKERII